MKKLLIPILLATMSITTYAEEQPRPRIYQLLVRTFSNTNQTRKNDGTLAENGTGKFNDINNAALKSLADMGFTHVWFTGILEQASGTSYPKRPADTPDILKGTAGSPYAIRDYFDVCPDYAVDYDKRLDEFKALLERCRKHGLTPLIDLVPNHVARSYASDVRPDLTFGDKDDKSVFYAPNNNFFYLNEHSDGNGPPLKLPTAHFPNCDGLFEPEKEFGRVTGNNINSWEPSLDTWYETVKLNYGHDYTKGRDTSHLPGPFANPNEVPDTWKKMDSIIAHWQKLGVGGFRSDMSHMVPMEFWRWAIAKARKRQKNVFFMAEAYDDDPQKLTDGNVLDALIDAGFNATYGHPIYKMTKEIYDGHNWANDLDRLMNTGPRFHKSVNYGENHDEVRLASPGNFGNIGMKVGRAVSTIAWAVGKGPIMLYHGQEVGEAAREAEGFGGQDGRTSIFDYWSLPELSKWVNNHKYDGGQLSEDQKKLRAWYGKVITLMGEPAFEKGELYNLNSANAENQDFGRLNGEGASGHWLYAFVRSEQKEDGQSYLVVVNLNGHETMKKPKVIIPRHCREWMKIEKNLSFKNSIGASWTGNLKGDVLSLPDLPPATALFLKITGK